MRHSPLCFVPSILLRRHAGIPMTKISLRRQFLFSRKFPDTQNKENRLKSKTLLFVFIVISHQ